MREISKSGSRFVLGAGVTGLSCGLASGYDLFEAEASSGGICASYYLRPGSGTRLSAVPQDEDAYRFEYGGGHWIFGGDPGILSFIDSLTPTTRHQRRSAVYFPHLQLYVPYPLQNHLSYLGKDAAIKALREIASASRSRPRTMADSLEQSFGPTLVELFFGPFHELYTAGLWTRIGPQDSYKSPDSLDQAIQGALDDTPQVGYNATFAYPTGGLDQLVSRMADPCNIHFLKQVTKLDLPGKSAEFTDGSSAPYEQLISTLPLSLVSGMAGLSLDVEPDPYTSVLVVNIGATRGPCCPDYHWLYLPSSRAGFHRVGFYSNVDRSFLPARSREDMDRVSIYVEKAYRGGQRPGEDEVVAVCQAVVQELRDWKFIDDAEVVDPTWVDVAYTWSWPGSTWKQRTLELLQENGVYQLGRYGRWVFQGIADSLRDGFVAGASMRHSTGPRGGPLTPQTLKTTAASPIR